MLQLVNEDSRNSSLQKKKISRALVTGQFFLEPFYLFRCLSMQNDCRSCDFESGWRGGGFNRPASIDCVYSSFSWPPGTIRPNPTVECGGRLRNITQLFASFPASVEENAFASLKQGPRAVKLVKTRGKSRHLAIHHPTAFLSKSVSRASFPGSQIK